MDDGISAMLIGDELRDALCVLPSYTPEIRNKDKQERLSALNDLFNIYYPFPFSEEIYSKLYLSLLRSLKKKNSADTVRQLNHNDSVLHGTQFSGILGGADSFTIIGRSGIGKSTAISRSVSVIAEDVIETHSPFRKIIPALTIQCPWDASVKGMLLEILRQTDNRIGTDYCEKALKRRSTTDLLIGSVSSVCIHHVGLLIIDEIQNVVSAKNGTALIRALTQLINSSGISICMVGTPECEQFFEEDYKLARRSIGLFYDKLPLDRHFTDFCEVVWNYRYVAEETEISDGIIKWLYEHSGGITSNVISLIHAAQQIAIADGREKLSLEVLSDAYREQMRMLHRFEEANKPMGDGNRTQTASVTRFSVLFASRSLTYARKPASFETKIARKSLFLRCKAVFTEQIFFKARKTPKVILDVLPRRLTKHWRKSVGKNQFCSAPVTHKKSAGRKCQSLRLILMFRRKYL